MKRFFNVGEPGWLGIAFSYRFSEKSIDREIRTDTSWYIQIDCGLEIYQGPLGLISGSLQKVL